jgi:hypothetical protein
VDAGAFVSFASGATAVFVVRFLETLSLYNAQMALFSMQRSDEFIGFDVHLRTISSVLNLCIRTWSAENTCTVANAPLNTWIRVAYKYHPSASPRSRLVVEYTDSSGGVISSSGTNNNAIQNSFCTRKILFGYSAEELVSTPSEIERRWERFGQLNSHFLSPMQ